MQFENQTIENVVFEECLEDSEYSDCVFRGCDFTETKMKNCSFDNCEFHKCTFVMAEFTFCTMCSCAFVDCNLIGINWSELQERGSIFFAARFLKSCVLKSNSFLHLKLPACEFTGSIIQDTHFEECDLKKGDFRKVNFIKAAFENCDLRQADFREAKNYLIDTNSNKVKGAKFSYPDVVNLLIPLGIKIDNM